MTKPAMRARCARCTMTFRVGPYFRQCPTLGQNRRCPEADCNVHFYDGKREDGIRIVSVTKEEMRYRGLSMVDESLPHWIDPTGENWAAEKVRQRAVGTG